MLLNSNHIYVLYLVTQSCPMLYDPMDCSPPGTSVHGNSPSKNTPVSGFPCPSPGDLPNPGIEHRSPTVWEDSLPSETLGKPHVIYNRGLNKRVIWPSHWHVMIYYRTIMEVIWRIPQGKTQGSLKDCRTVKRMDSGSDLRCFWRWCWQMRCGIWGK